MQQLSHMLCLMSHVLHVLCFGVTSRSACRPSSRPRKAARRLDEFTSARGSLSTSGALETPEADQLREVQARINALVQINQQQVDRLEDLKHHNKCCLCTVDCEAAVNYLQAQIHRNDQLSQDIRTVDEHTEAVRRAMSDADQQHHLRLDSLEMRVKELENRYQPWKEDDDQVTLATS